MRAIPADTWYKCKQPSPAKFGTSTHLSWAVLVLVVTASSHRKGIEPPRPTLSPNSGFLPVCRITPLPDRGFVSHEEIDLAWIRDGEFGIAKVKSPTDGFSKEDAEKLVKRATLARPCTVLLVSPEGEDKEIAKWRQRVNEPLEPLGIQVEAWGPSFFTQPSPYLV